MTRMHSRTGHVPFAICGVPYYVEGLIEDPASSGAPQSNRSSCTPGSDIAPRRAPSAAKISANMLSKPYAEACCLALNIRSIEVLIDRDAVAAGAPGEGHPCSATTSGTAAAGTTSSSTASTGWPAPAATSTPREAPPRRNCSRPRTTCRRDGRRGAHAVDVGPGDIRMAFSLVHRRGLDRVADREDVALRRVEGHLRDVEIVRAAPRWRFAADPLDAVQDVAEPLAARAAHSGTASARALSATSGARASCGAATSTHTPNVLASSSTLPRSPPTRQRPAG